MYTCLIADDHVVERDLIKIFLEKIPSLKLVAECSNGLEVSGFLQQQQVDIVFSDVDMPGLSGTDLVKALKNPPVFIFISSFPEYAAEGYNLDAIDFMSKPLRFDRFLKGVNKAVEYLELKKKLTNAALQQASGAIPEGLVQEGTAGEFFFIKDNKGYLKIREEDVLYIESMGDFSRIHTVQQKTHMILVSLKNLELQLNTGKFFRVHKQYIINLQHLVAVLQNDVVLTNDQDIPLSNSYKAAIQEQVIQKVLLKRF
ncbi:MAG: LytTR family DNA-binding domain-containing protein [Sediminibacterium sp.]